MYGIVKDHRGDIKVYSEMNKGTTFDIFFPVLHLPLDQHLPEAQVPAKTGTEKILLVDDEAPIVKLEKIMLERLGYQVCERTSSLDALEAFKANPDSFDLIISDMAMPNMTGDRLALKIKEIRPEIPIILCTGFSNKLDEMKMEHLGIQGVLMKPVIKSELANMVRNALDATQQP